MIKAGVRTTARATHTHTQSNKIAKRKLFYERFTIIMPPLTIERNFL